ncbi:MAG TPA: hypothetical protein VIO16_07760 [Dehalococcoidia bacterium]
MRQYMGFAASLLFAAACVGADRSIPTAPESAPAFAKQTASISLTDLGTLGGTTSDAVSLNTPSAGNRLLIVGSSSDRAGTTHAAYWYVDMTTGARQVGALPAPAGDAQSGASSVNQAEQIVGNSATTVGGLGKPVEWASSTSPPSFLNITGFTYGGAWKITPTGQSMGGVGDAGGSEAAIWDAGNLVLLPGLGGSTFIEDANAAGVIVGISKYNSTDGQRAVVWNNGSITQLPDGGSNSFALGINDAGIIVGMDWTSGTGSRAVRWLPPTTAGGLYTKEDLGVSGDAYDINNVGEIVGLNCVPGQVCKPFYWLDGLLKDLPMLQPVRGGGARSINENGDVVGWSRLPNSYQHAVLWTHVR